MSTKTRWWIPLLSLSLWLLLVAVFMVAWPASEGVAQGPEQSAHVVVQFSDGGTAVRPITWTGTISRVTALDMAGFTLVKSGGFVCSIDGDGCPSSNCFCADNWWISGQWDKTAWDGSFPFPDLAEGDVIVYRNRIGDFSITGDLPAAQTYVAASDALEWMRDQQGADGSYADAFGQMGASTRALIAIGAVGYDPAEWGTPSLLDFLTVTSASATVDYVASSAAAAGKVTLGAAWTDQDVSSFAGANLPVSVTTFYSPTKGSYGAGSGDTAWAILGLYAAGEAVPAKTIDYLKSVQNADGGWAWNEWGATSETQHTALVIQALLAAGEPATSTSIQDALAFVATARNSDGGYTYQPPATGANSDINATVYVVPALLSVGQVPAGNWCTGYYAQYPSALQNTDGSFPYFGAPSLYATQETIPALMHRPYGPVASWTYQCFTIHCPVIGK